MANNNRRNVGTVVLTVVMVVALQIGAVRAGMGTPGFEKLLGFSGTSTLDYSRFPSLLSRLSSEFISRILGIDGLTQDGTRLSSVRTGALARDAGFGQRIVVEHALTNDRFEDAYLVPSIPFTARTDGTGAKRQSSEPTGCSPVGGTVWYRYTPDRDLTLVASTIGTKQATSLAAFTGKDPAHLSTVEGACHKGVQGGAQIAFASKKGVTYYFQVTELYSQGPLVFNLDPLGTTQMASIKSDGGPGDSSSWMSAMSGDGRYVVFNSGSTDLVPGDTNVQEDVFVRDLLTGQTERVSLASDGTQGNGESKPWPPAISADGRFVAFTSDAGNFVEGGGDTNGWRDVFVHDRLTKTTTRVSVSSSGGQGTKPVTGQGDPLETGLQTTFGSLDDFASLSAVSISADGRYVAFDSALVGLVPEDGPGAEEETALAGTDIFLHDRVTRRTSLVSRSSSGRNGNAWSRFPAMSADGSVVAFLSSASNLVLGDPASPSHVTQEATTNDVFVHELASRRTERISVSIAGDKGKGQSHPPAISSDGRFVAFASIASDLVEEGKDTNEGMDVFVRDRRLGKTELVSVSTAGEQQVAGERVERSFFNAPTPAISWDGRYVAFHSDAPNLVPGDTNGFRGPDSDPGSPACAVGGEDIFVRDRTVGTTIRVSVSDSGLEGNGGSIYPAMSADGRRITFSSYADNLVSGDRESRVPFSCGESADAFVHTFGSLR